MATVSNQCTKYFSFSEHFCRIQRQDRDRVIKWCKKCQTMVHCDMDRKPQWHVFGLLWWSLDSVATDHGSSKRQSSAVTCSSQPPDHQAWLCSSSSPASTFAHQPGIQQPSSQPEQNPNQHLLLAGIEEEQHTLVIHISTRYILPVLDLMLMLCSMILTKNPPRHSGHMLWLTQAYSNFLTGSPVVWPSGWSVAATCCVLDHQPAAACRLPAALQSWLSSAAEACHPDSALHWSCTSRNTGCYGRNTGCNSRNTGFNSWNTGWCAGEADALTQQFCHAIWQHNICLLAWRSSHVTVYQVEDSSSSTE